MSERQTRAERARMPIAPHVAKAVAQEHGVCIRPFAVQRTDLETGDTETVDVPCGATLASKCGPCAERKRRLRMAQCREGAYAAKLAKKPASPSSRNDSPASTRT